MRRYFGVIAAAAIVALLASGNAWAAKGAAGVGDSVLPHAGNGGYDVLNYDVNVRYTPKSNYLRVTNTITARAKVDLSRFNLDFRGPLKIKGLDVDWAPIPARRSPPQQDAWVRRQPELVIKPVSTIPAGTTFQATVLAVGRPHGAKGPVEGGGPIGFVPTDDGAWVANEPDGASTWLPSNDHPSDKATLSMEISVPKGLEAISNGELVSQTDQGKRSIWTWRSDNPIATYLITATIGQFRIDQAPIDGLDSVVAVDAALPGDAAEQIAPRDTETRSVFEKKIAPYPFDSTGAIIDKGPPDVFYALETQNRPIYNANTGGRFTPPATALIAHETAHEWFGNSVTPARWKDIWLNEGFASWAEWLWSESISRSGRSYLDRNFDFYYRMVPRFISEREGRKGVKEYWRLAPGRVNERGELFDSAVYNRGALTVQALRYEVGKRDFYEILRRWVTANAYGNATTKQFITLAENVSGQKLRKFFDEWLFESGEPNRWWSPGNKPSILEKRAGQIRHRDVDRRRLVRVVEETQRR
jgi:aminopeptidase N